MAGGRGKQHGKKPGQEGSGLGLESSPGGKWSPWTVPSTRASGAGVREMPLPFYCWKIALCRQHRRQDEKEEAKLLQKAGFASQTLKLDEDTTFHYLMYVINTASNVFI